MKLSSFIGVFAGVSAMGWAQASFAQSPFVLKVETAEVAAALKKYIDPDKFVSVHAGDFAKSAK